RFSDRKIVGKLFLAGFGYQESLPQAKCRIEFMTELKVDESPLEPDFCLQKLVIPRRTFDILVYPLQETVFISGKLRKIFRNQQFDRFTKAGDVSAFDSTFVGRPLFRVQRVKVKGLMINVEKLRCQHQIGALTAHRHYPYKHKKASHKGCL